MSETRETVARSARNVGDLLLFLAVALVVASLPLIYFCILFSFPEIKKLLGILHLLFGLGTLGMAVFSFWRMCTLGRTWLRDVASHLLEGTAVAGEELEKWIIRHIWAAPITELAFIAMVWYFFVTIMPGSADGGYFWALGFNIVTLLGLGIFVLLPLLSFRAFVINANKALRDEPHKLQRSAMVVATCMALMSLLFLAACFVAPLLFLGLPLLVMWFVFGNFVLQLVKALS